MARTIRLPARFFNDHRERDLPCPEVVRSNSRYVYVIPEGEGWDDLLSDARYYDTFDGIAYQENRAIVDAARRTLVAIRRGEG